MGRKNKWKKAPQDGPEKTVRQMLSDSLKLPRDMMMGAAILTVIGNGQILVENYRGILEYTDCCIMLQAKTCRICIRGRCLQISYYTNEDMKIEGIITEITYI